ELYHVPDDFSEAVNLAAKDPQRVRDLQELFWAEAARNHVLPLLDVVHEAMAGGGRAPSSIDGVNSFTFYAGMTRIPELAAPNVKDRSFTISADLVIPQAGAEGVLLTEGDRFGGYSLYLLKGRPVFCYNMAALKLYTVAAPDALDAGQHKLTADFKYDGGGRGKGGTVTLSIDGKSVASGRVGETIPNRFALDASMSVGEATGAAVSTDYETPFKLTAILDKLTLTLN
ncbi:MAG: arylsulfatase family protein, partial [Rhodospirillales bacterium]|nr:arylsulfatase family protein [Rhodospirillales bacterium]